MIYIVIILLIVLVSQWFNYSDDNHYPKILMNHCGDQTLNAWEQLKKNGPYTYYPTYVPEYPRKHIYPKWADCMQPWNSHNHKCLMQVYADKQLTC